MKLGEITFHKAMPGMKMVVVFINNPGIKCCYYNPITGEFSQGTFYEYELISEETKEKDPLYES